MNKVFLTGRFAANPSSFASANATPNSRFDLAVTDSKISTETYFFPCVCFGSRANYINSYLKKGDFVIVEGRITRRKYTTRDGKNAYSTDVVVDDIQLVGNSNNQNYYNQNNNQDNDLEPEVRNTKTIKKENKISIDKAFQDENESLSVVNNKENDKIDDSDDEEDYPSWMNDL